MEVWCDCRRLSSSSSGAIKRTSLLDTLRGRPFDGLSHPFDALLFRQDGSADAGGDNDDANLVAFDSMPSSAQAPNLAAYFHVPSDDHLFRHPIRPDATPMGTVINLSDTDGQERAMAAAGSVEWILATCGSSVDGPGCGVNTVNWRMIPAENILSACRPAGTKLAFSVEREWDVQGLAHALELGVDALCVAVDADPALWEAVWKAQKERQKASGEKKEERPGDGDGGGPAIVPGRCWRLPTKETILADRVCVDLVRTLLTTEGCWVGSSAKCMVLVLSEAAASALVPSRPFRVNAGPVHSYIIMGDGATTKYLCELRPGDHVQVYDAASCTSRSVAVGRLKVEVRPCSLIRLARQPVLQQERQHPPPELAPASGSNEDDVWTAQVLLQQAETVRLGKESGSFCRVTDLKTPPQRSAVGNKHSDCDAAVDDIEETILLRLVSTGTHIGRAYSGNVKER